MNPAALLRDVINRSVDHLSPPAPPPPPASQGPGGLIKHFARRRVGEGERERSGAGRGLAELASATRVKPPGGCWRKGTGGKTKKGLQPSAELGDHSYLHTTGSELSTLSNLTEVWIAVSEEAAKWQAGHVFSRRKGDEMSRRRKVMT